MRVLKPYLGLIFYKTYADLKAETERTYLGFLWWIFEPIMFMLVFYIIFGLLMNRGPEDFVPFLLIGLTTWQWMKSCINHGANTILQNRALLQRVYLPKVIFPTVLILTDTVKFIFIFALLLVYLWLSGHTPTAFYLALPAILLTQLLLITALTYFTAALVPFIPDLRFVIETLLTGAFFLSGIFFVASEVVPEKYRFYFYLNPMANLIEDYRLVLMYKAWPDWSALTLIAAASALGIWGGAAFLRRFEYLYPRISA